MDYNFEWDPYKAIYNNKKHRVTFEESATVFRDPRALTIYDDEHSEYEERWLTIGISVNGRLLMVSHTFQKIVYNSVTIRIFSSRKATKSEVKDYEGSV